MSWWLPTPYLGVTFDGSHQRYLTTGSTVLDAADVESGIKHITEHDYGLQPGSQLLIIANPLDVEASGMTAWRPGIEYRSGAPLPKWDFIPSALMPAWVSAETIHGPIPNAEFNGLQVWGSYGGALLIRSNYLPRNYAVVIATGGPDSDANPVGFREHINPAYQGLRHIPERGPYPIQESFFERDSVPAPDTGAGRCHADHDRRELHPADD
jgi:hypothetical protein